MLPFTQPAVVEKKLDGGSNTGGVCHGRFLTSRIYVKLSAFSLAYFKQHDNLPNQSGTECSTTIASVQIEFIKDYNDSSL